MRLNILPDERLAPLRGTLEQRLQEVAQSIRPSNFPALCDGMVRRLLQQTFQQCGSQEGLIWLFQICEAKEVLIPSFGLGPTSEKLVGTYQQSLREGIVSMVMMSEQPFIENEVFKNAQHSKKVDEKFNQQTFAMIVVPFYFLQRCRGVISCVQLKSPDPQAPIPPGFKSRDLKNLLGTSSVITELIDYRLLRETIPLP